MKDKKMEKNSYVKKNCRLCQSRNLKLALKIQATPLADEYITKKDLDKVQPKFPLDLMLCKDCGQVQLRDVVNPKLMYVDYIYKTVSSLGLVKHFQNYASHTIHQYKLPKNSLIIDIGSNDGSLLKAFKKKGMRVLGIDPARDIANAATQEGIETIPHFFTMSLAKKIKRKYGPASIVTVNNLYANIDNLVEFTKSIKYLLAPTGLFIFESAYILDLIKNMVFDFIHHEHYSYFSVKPLSQFLTTQGMEIINVNHIPTKGGSIRYTVKLQGSQYKKSPSVTKQILKETKFGLHKPQTYIHFEKRITKMKDKLNKFLNKIQKKGKVVGGYGASATSTTLLYHFGLTDRIKFFFDDYTSKQFTFSPRAHIPVLPGSHILKEKPDYILILAWRYWLPIIKKNQRFMENGGHFIIPLPKLKII